MSKENTTGTPFFNWYIDLPKNAILGIGSTEDCAIVVRGASPSEILTITNIDGEYVIGVEYAESPVYVDNKQVSTDTALRNQMFIEAYGCLFYFRDGKLFFDKDQVRIRRLRINQVESSNNFSYPKFVRNTRQKIIVNDEKISILEPASVPSKPEQNLILSLLPAVAMIALVVVMRGVMGSGNSGYLLFSVGSMSIGFISSIGTFVHSKNKYKKELQKRIDVYNKYIEDKTSEIELARGKELSDLKQIYRSPAENIEMLKNFDVNIFDRIPEDSDFIDIYLGEGERVSAREIDYKKQEQLEQGDELTKIPVQIAEKYKRIQNAPITTSIRNAGVIGVSGGVNDRYGFLKNMVLDIIARQYPSDIDMYLFIEGNRDDFKWAKDIPHLNSDNGFRRIVFDEESKTNVFEALYKELTFREEHKGEYKQILAFVMDDYGMMRHPISRYVAKAKELNISFVFFARTTSFLPLYCSEIIEVNSGNGVIYLRENINERQSFKYSVVSDADMLEVATRISPVYCEEISLESALRKSCTLFETLGINNAGELNIGGNWSRTDITRSMATPIGFNAKNELVMFDMLDNRHGPHGLVAGTTGSGKSELLLSILVSLATNYHPYEVGFLIIDFKGGGMSNRLEKFPHMMGAITDLEGKEITRSLKSIEAEINRRKRIFGENNIVDINHYNRVLRAGQVSELIPHLIIVVDEFAELKAQQPEFMDKLISVARVGRSLGFHLILSTQKPAGQVSDQIETNVNFRLCLKVQSPEDSKEVIKTPLAAEIKERGRAYLMVGDKNILELFQSAYSGGPTDKNTESNSEPFEVYGMGLGGCDSILYRKKASTQVDIGETELDAIAAQIDSYCEKQGIKRLPPICLPALPDHIDYDSSIKCEDSLMEVPIGIFDSPENQTQDVLSLNVGRSNTLIVGASQMGKTNMLQTCIRSLAENNSPEEVAIYIMDFGSAILKQFESLKHVGGVVLASEDEKVKNLFKLIYTEMDTRKNKLMSAGVSSFAGYQEAGFRDMSKMYIMLDNFTAFRELYFEEFEDIFSAICRDGLSLGISFVVTNASSSGIGYRHITNFAEKICLTCNEPGEYYDMLDGARMEPHKVPGRFVLSVNKEPYEAQAFLAFMGEKEFERAADIRKFINDTNLRYEDSNSAISIPCIPDVLHKSDFMRVYGSSIEEHEIPIGLNFDKIEPVIVSAKSDGELAIIAKNKEAGSTLLHQIIDYVDERSIWKTFIFDGPEAKLKSYAEHQDISYSIGVDNIEDTISEIESQMDKKRMNVFDDEESNDVDTTLIVINGKDLMKSISDQYGLSDKIIDLIDMYKYYGLLVIFAGIEDSAISYSAPELLRHVRDSRKAIIFNNANQIKAMDIGFSEAKKYSKPNKSDEAFILNDEEFIKVKTIIN